MKRLKYLFVIAVLFIFPLVVHANKIGDFKQTIDVDVDCSECNPWEEQSVTLQLYADGEPVEGKNVVLNPETGYKTKFENLDLFKEDFKQIEYEVKYLKDGNYVSMPNKEITRKKVSVNKWVSVLPDDMEDGHEYVLLTDNWNYENNGFSKYVVLRGDVTVKGAKPDADYKIINGKKSYYSLTEEPPANAKWVYTKGEESIKLTDEIGKNLTLTGYNRGYYIDYIFKYSGKVGFIESDNAYNNNEIVFDKIDNTLGRFYVTSKSLWPEPNNGTYYLGLNFYNQVEAQSVREYGAQFLAFEYYEGEAEVETEISVSMKLCEKAPDINPNTVDNIAIYIGIFIIAVALIVLALVLKKKKSK
jgi:hypothetical protein